LSAETGNYPRTLPDEANLVFNAGWREYAPVSSPDATAALAAHSIAGPEREIENLR